MKGVPTLYHVRVLLAEPEFLDVGDWGAPHCIALADKLKDCIQLGSDSSEMEALRRELVHKKNTGKEWRNYGFNEIALRLQARGIKALRYPNVVEGLLDSPSLCVISPASIKLLSFVTLDDEELEAASKSERVKIPPVTL